MKIKFVVLYPEPGSKKGVQIGFVIQEVVIAMTTTYLKKESSPFPWKLLQIRSANASDAQSLPTKMDDIDMHVRD
ncbi:MAG: hypothetical protein UT58_C0024G0008 [Microgenomates group bacterium GW2011_GWC1_39_7b]|uniref:Uncharacterized protein n=3 Tax=Candidatus Woeseibacteriota TaxID=1752722 RepID=A0A0G0XX74_9BACT|nr:MAG: hypothetical protein UT17_C0002G0122 [Candidatus Woesebacteria bacterium GW2011_GWB1_39_10]KKR26048.1 MAG: hypothetical protein UT58_C0024G0008 [Microgenomates group bacterium GW2011_GWC1_39_7b]KKR72557.1 MAG: hypothetical protein UU16_C0039G0009 [Candidatus Woesebacteria bacterium GW2011_GWA2_40_7]KKR92527.1 MAG: hypothetical protein UU42_C0001G0131 [Candidatus Woesebacteria bacterium GW2011_GWA1_41_13b]